MPVGGVWLAASFLLAAPPSETAEARLRKDVVHLATAFHPRAFGYPENLEKASGWIAERFRDAGGEVTFQAYTVNGAPYRNVLARFGPETRSRLVLGAHYDAVRATPGADDNASGVAVLLEVARLLGRQAPRLRVELAAYACEEPPCFRTAAMGSAQHARRLRQEGAEVRAMVSVDMVGDYGAGTVPASAFSPVVEHTLAVVGDEAQGGAVRALAKSLGKALAPALQVVPVVAPRTVPGIDWSDHHPFWDAGYPGVMVTDGAWARNKAYHSPGDVPERLDFRRMAELARALNAWVLAEKP